MRVMKFRSGLRGFRLCWENVFFFFSVLEPDDWYDFLPKRFLLGVKSRTYGSRHYRVLHLFILSEVGCPFEQNRVIDTDPNHRRSCTYTSLLFFPLDRHDSCPHSCQARGILPQPQASCPSGWCSVLVIGR